MRTRLLILTFLFLSGATSLVYELVWSKHLANVLGNSGQAHAVVLATFMGGLALGAYLFGRLADRVSSPLRLYGALELVIGLYALGFRPVLDALSTGYLAIAPAVPESLRLFPKLGLAGLSVAIPTLLMGGTLPALVRHFTADLGALRKELARLYAVNSLGAACGVFLAGVELVPSLGLAGSTRWAAAVNLALAVAAILLSLRAPRASTADTADASSALYPVAAVRAARVCVMLSGFTSMLLEVTWIRLLTLVLGSSSYAFTLILTAFIAGIGLGSFWLTTREDRGDGFRLFAWLQVGVVVSVCIALPLYVRLPHLFWVAHHSLRRTEAAWPVYQGLTFFFCCAVLLLPTFFMGAAFPAVARVATAKVDQLGRQLGGVYLWNTLGTLSGSALGGLVLLPALGMEGNFATALAVTLIAAGLAFTFAPSGPATPLRRLVPVAAALGCALLYLGGTAGWSRFVANADAFRQREQPFDSFATYRATIEHAFETLFLEDDTFATVLVGQGRTTGHRFMRINGKVDASNASDIETQILAGHLGVLLHPRPVRNVLLVGAGAAVTAGSILAHGVERVDLVEISPAVIEGARLFAEDNRHALDDPRLHVHIDDAKTFLALSPHRYDLVVSVPSNPWVSGVSGLFSRDFFEGVQRKLEPDGLVVQWVHTYESTEPLVKLVVRTFREGFPHATAWLGPQDLLFVGSRAPLEIDPERLGQRLARPQVAEDLARADASDLVSLLARQVYDEAGLARFAGQGAINTDDRNELEYAAPIAFFIDKPPFTLPDQRRSGDPTQGLALSRYLAEHPLEVDGARRLHRALARYPRGNASLLRATGERWLELAPGDPEAALALARTALLQDDQIAALALLRPLLEAGDRRPQLLLPFLLARTRQLRLGRTAWNPDPAGEDLRFALEARSSHPGDAPLAKAVEELCTVLPPGSCPVQP